MGTVQVLFERPIQTATAISQRTGISRFTIIQACQKKLFKEDAYQSGATWLIDSTGQHFLKWLAEHETQPRVVGKERDAARKSGT